jgi:hypothetical protein
VGLEVANEGEGKVTLAGLVQREGQDAVPLNGRSRFPLRPRLIAAASSTARTTRSLKIAARITG